MSLSASSFGATSRRSQTSKKYLTKSSSEIGVELIRMRSRTAMRWGDMKRPVLRGVPLTCWYWERMESTNAQVLPLPLVPATWTMLSLFKSDGWDIMSMIHIQCLGSVGLTVYPIRWRYVFISWIDTALGFIPAFLRASTISKGVWRELSASIASWLQG